VNSANDFGTATGSIWSFVTGSPADEDFETGDFSLYPWTFGGNQDWTVQTSEVYEGMYSAKSGSINGNQTSELIIELNVEEAGQISFYTKISCEEDSNNNWDYLAFYIDNAEQERWDGEVSWSYRSYDVAAGNRTFKWKYLKDGNVDDGGDCAWLDNITFPNAAQGQPDFVINPEEFNFEMMNDETNYDQFTIENIGVGAGEYSIEILWPDVEGEWLQLSSYEGTVNPGETNAITMAVNTDDMEDGSYIAEIFITDNSRNETTIPVNLTVSNVNADNDLNAVTGLIGNYPNPFNPSTVISYSLTAEDAEKAKIVIFNSKGQKVDELEINSQQTSVSWNAEGFSSGIYFYKLSAGKNTQMKKMVLMK
jgi:hypothetical protein